MSRFNSKKFLNGLKASIDHLQDDYCEAIDDGNESHEWYAYQKGYIDALTDIADEIEAIINN